MAKKKKSKFWEMLGKTNAKLNAKIYNFFCKNVFIKIISLLFAMLLWGYVLMEQNPDRIKILDHVSVSFDGESDLISRKLVIRGDRDALLSSVSVKVSTKLIRYADLDASDVNAVVSLKNISKAGTYVLPVSASSPLGSVQSISPSTVEVEIDELVTKRIPIEYSVVGTLQSGYWAGEPVLSRTEIDIEGPRSDISTIVKGICYIDITRRTSSYNEAIPIVLIDVNGNEVSSSILLGQLPSVSVKQEILMTKELPIDVAGALLGEESIDNSHEVVEAIAIPSKVMVAGPEAQLAALSTLSIEMIDISGRTESLLTEAQVHVPEGIRLLDEDLVTVYVDIREKTGEAAFEQLPIKVRGVAKNTDVSLLTEYADIFIRGKMSLINSLDRSDVVLYIDVTDLVPGTYAVDVLVDFPKHQDDELSHLEYTLSVNKVTVTIKK